MTLRHVAALSVAVLVTGCTPTDGIKTTPITPIVLSSVLPPGLIGTVDLAAVDITNPDDVARAVVTTLNQYDTRTDSSPAAAAGRAAPLLTLSLATELTEVDIRTDSTWLDLEQHDGYTEATTELVNEYGQPANTTTAALAQVSVTVQAIGRDGWTCTERARVVRVQLSRTSAVEPWLASGFPS